MKNLLLYRRLIMLLILLLIKSNILGCNNTDESYCDFNAEISSGIAPTVWLNRDSFAAISINAITILQLQSAYIPLFQMPHFSELFGMPWIVRGHMGYMITRDQEIYAEFNYRQAHKHRFTLNNLVIPNIDTIYCSLLPQNNYRALSIFAGIRKYWQPCLCQSLDVFLGGKVGLVRHQKINFTFSTYSLAVPVPYTSDSLVLFKKNIGIAGGLNAGCEFDVACDLKLLITAEIVASCGPRANAIAFDYATQSVLINAFLAPNNFITGSIGTELFFPITIGVKYNF